MSYQGGKKRLGNKIYTVIKILEKYFNYDNSDYIEPFVGFCGVIKHFNNDTHRNLFGYDINENIIKMWCKLQEGWIPPIKCSKKYYDELKENTIISAEKGFIGVACSYSGIFFGGGFRNNQKYKDKDRNSLEIASRSVLKSIDLLKNVKFISSSYDILNPVNSTIYCDPPYFSNKYNSKYFMNFNFEKFWQKIRNWSQNNLVIISERIAPEDFICIWEKVNNVIHSNKNSKQTEKLFIHKNLYDKMSEEIKYMCKIV